MNKPSCYGDWNNRWDGDCLCCAYRGTCEPNSSQGLIKADNRPSWPEVMFDSISDQDFTRLLSKAGLGHKRVYKLGDEDYVPQCETTRRYIDEQA